IAAKWCIGEQMRSLVVISAAAVFISGCAVFPDKTLEYQKAKTIDKMEVPEGMTFSVEDERYPIVKEDERLQHKPKRKDRFKAPEPPQLITLDEDGEQEEPATEEPTNLKPMLGRDGNGYPILMLNTSFSWAWEYVTRAVENMELSVLDVNRSAGVVYVSLPK